MRRQGLLQRQSWNPAARQWHAHSLLALQGDDGSPHTLMGAPGSPETDQALGHTHTLAVRTWLLVAFQRKEIEIHK